MGLCSESKSAGADATFSYTHNDLFILLDCFLVLVFVGRRLEYPDVVMGDIGEDLMVCFSMAFQAASSGTHSSLEEHDLLLSQSIGFSDNGDQVDLRVQSPHELDINWL
jgi:hypothetical protein